MNFSEPVKNNFVSPSDFVITNTNSSVSVSNIELKISVSTIAGNGTDDDIDGLLANARFDGLNDTIALPNGDLLVLDSGNKKIKRVNSTHVSTVFDLNNTIIGVPSSFTRDQDGSIYVTSPSGIYKILPDGSISTIPTITPPSGGIDIGLNGSLYVSVNNSRDSHEINPNDGSFIEIFNFEDRFGRRGPVDIAKIPGGTVYVSLPTLTVVGTTIPIQSSVYAGNFSLYAGEFVRGESRDSAPSVRGWFHAPYSLALSTSGILYVADETEGNIRQVPSYLLIQTLAGSTETGYMDGDGAAARFEGGSGIDVGPERYNLCRRQKQQRTATNRTIQLFL